MWGKQASEGLQVTAPLGARQGQPESRTWVARPLAAVHPMRVKEAKAWAVSPPTAVRWVQMGAGPEWVARGGRIPPVAELLLVASAQARRARRPRAAGVERLLPRPTEAAVEAAPL